MMGLISPIMIMMISWKAPAALPLYWVIGGTFLIIQTYISQKLYQNPTVAKEKSLQKNK